MYQRIMISASQCVHKPTSNRLMHFYLLFCHGHHGCLIHFHVGDSHSAENCECFNKVFVIRGEWQIVELVNQLKDTDYFSRAARIFDGHGQDRRMLKLLAAVNRNIEPKDKRNVKDARTTKLRKIFGGQTQAGTLENIGVARTSKDTKSLLLIVTNINI